MQSEWRLITDRERQILNLLVRNFGLVNLPLDWQDELQKQLDRAKARIVDENGSLIFDTSERKGAPGPFVASVIGRVPDSDGMPIFLELLISPNGYVEELDIWKGDGSRILKQPDANQMEITEADNRPATR